MRSLKTLLFLLFLSWSSQSNAIQDEPFQKNILKGNHELGIEGYFYADDEYSMLSVSGAYRYFFFDRFSFGVIGNHDISRYFQNHSVGASMRYYFAEMGNWAFSFTQNVSLGYNDWRGLALTGQSQLGAHYFVTPELSLGFVLSQDYELREAMGLKPFVTGKIGIQYNF